MQRQAWLAAAVVGAVAGGIAIGAAQSANASNSDAPSLEANGHKFYAPGQIDGAWRAVTKDYPAALPAGVTFPRKAPGFFHDAATGGDKIQGWEDGFPATIAAQYWRCAWLYDDLHPTSSIDAGSASASAHADALAQAQLQQYVGLPGVSLGESQFSSDMATIAQKMGVSKAQAEYQVNCGPEIYVPGNGAGE